MWGQGRQGSPWRLCSLRDFRKLAQMSQLQVSREHSFDAHFSKISSANFRISPDSILTAIAYAAQSPWI